VFVLRQRRRLFADLNPSQSHTVDSNSDLGFIFGEGSAADYKWVINFAEQRVSNWIATFCARTLKCPTGERANESNRQL